MPEVVVEVHYAQKFILLFLIDKNGLVWLFHENLRNIGHQHVVLDHRIGVLMP